jgi:hypothetical protein
MPRRQVTRTAAASQPSDTKHEILIWQVKREQREAEERQRELEELDRDTRTVFAYNLSTKAGERDLFEFFTRAGGVRGCYCMVGFTRYTERNRIYRVGMLQELGANDPIRSRYSFCPSGFSVPYTRHALRGSVPPRGGCSRHLAPRHPCAFARLSAGVSWPWGALSVPTAHGPTTV